MRTESNWYENARLMKSETIDRHFINQVFIV